jgi:hypothetical protein
MGPGLIKSTILKLVFVASPVSIKEQDKRLVGLDSVSE